MLPVLSSLCVILLGLYLVPVWRASRWRGMAAQAPAMAATAWVTALETLMRLYPALAEEHARLLLLSQHFLCVSWLLFSLAYARKISWGLLGNLNKLLVLLSLLPLGFLPVLPVSSFLFFTDFSVEPLIFLESPAFYFYLHLALVLLLSLGNLESTLQSSRHSERWRIKLALLGAGAIIVSFVLFYSQGLLYRVLNMDYLALRTLGILIGLALLHFSEWRRESGKVIVSRRVAFRSLAVVVAGLYLLGLGIAREGAEILGAGSRQHLLLALLFLGGLAGLVLLLSQTGRRRAGIWLQRALYNEKYDYRSQWIEFSERLSRAADKESLIREVLLGFCETFGFVGAVFVPARHDGSGHAGGAVHYEMPETEPADTLAEDCSALLAYPGVPVEVSTELPRLPDGAAGRLEAMNASLFLPVPAADGPEGVIILGRPMDGKEEYDREDFELMEAMSRQIGLCVRSFRLGDELSAAREMEALGRLGAFVLHDLKNQVYALSLLTENARTFIGNPDFQRDMLETLGNTVANMKILIAQLTDPPGTSALRLEPVDLRELARRAAALVPGANVRISGSSLTVNADADQICKVLTNLCLNAVEAGGDQPIGIEIHGGEAPTLRVRDNGGGIPEEIMRRGLFKPFNSGKRRGMGIGLYHSQKIMEAHGGKIFVENRPGEGSTFIVRFAWEEDSRAARARGDAARATA